MRPPSRSALELAWRGARVLGALVVPVELDAAAVPAEARDAEVAPGLRGEVAGWRDDETVTVNVAVADLGAWLGHR